MDPATPADRATSTDLTTPEPKPTTASDSSNPVDPSNTTFLKTERNAVILLAGIFSLRMLAVFMILPIFALFAKGLPGATPSSVGLALGIYGLIQALLQAPFGYISDRCGRKPVIVLGLFIFAIGSMVAAMSHSITGIILGRSLQGAGAIGSVIMALLTDLTRPQVRSKAMAFVGISIGASFALAFVLGPLVNTWVGVPGMFWLMAIFALFAIVLVYTCLPDESFASESQPISSTQSVLTEAPSSIYSVLHPTILPIYFCVLVIHACLTALFLKLPIAVASFMPEGKQALLFYLPIFLASAITTFPCLSRIEKIKNYAVILISCLSIMLISFLTMYFGLGTALYLGLGLYLFFTVFNVLEASLPSYLSKKVVRKYKGTALGIFSSLQFLGLCLGGVLGGWLDEHFGTLAVFAFCVILTMVLLVWILILNSKLKRLIWHVA